jgi:hypothetical protein
VVKQVEDTTKLHVGSFIQRNHQRDMEKKAEMAKYHNPHIKRTVGFCHGLKNEVEDLEDAWDFVKNEQLESEDEDDEMKPEQKEFKELTAEDMGKVNTALQAHMLIIAELKRKIEHELYMAEAAATGGWGGVSVLENKMFTNVSGATDAVKEMKTQRIRKAIETYTKEQRLHKKVVPMNGLFKPKKRPGQHLGFGLKKFGSKFHGNFGGYGGYDGMAATVGGQEGQGSYGPSYGGDGGYRGRGGYGNRGAGGSRGGAKPTRTCHRSVPWLR